MHARPLTTLAQCYDALTALNKQIDGIDEQLSSFNEGALSELNKMLQLLPSTPSKNAGKAYNNLSACIAECERVKQPIKPALIEVFRELKRIGEAFNQLEQATEKAKRFKQILKSSQANYNVTADIYEKSSAVVSEAIEIKGEFANRHTAARSNNSTVSSSTSTTFSYKQPKQPGSEPPKRNRCTIM